MVKVKGYRALLAVSAALLGMISSGAVLAADNGPADIGEATSASPGLLQSMTGDRLEKSGITLRGYAEAGFVFNIAHVPDGGLGYGNLFNDKSDDPTLNQISLVIQRNVVPQRGRFDVGFIAQGIFGADARFLHSNGANFYGSHWAGDLNNSALPQILILPPAKGVPSSIAGPTVIQPGNPLRNSYQSGPENQGDILQAAVTLALPVGNGMLLTAGKIVTPWGMETVDPTISPLYSHSYMYDLSTPKTLTGVTALYRVNQSLDLMGGVVVGWDQSLEDNNDFPSFVAQAAYQFEPEWGFTLSAIVGPEETHDRSHYRSVVDLTTNVKISNELTVGGEGLVGYEPNSGTAYQSQLGFYQNFNVPFVFLKHVDALQFTGQDAVWMGAALYITNKLDEDGMLTLIARAEYFNDMDGGGRAFANEIFSATVGFKVVPFPHDRYGRNLMFRPEVRWDYGNETVFDDNTHRAQVTIGADMIYSF